MTSTTEFKTTANQLREATTSYNYIHHSGTNLNTSSMPVKAKLASKPKYWFCYHRAYRQKMHINHDLVAKTYKSRLLSRTNMLFNLIIFLFSINFKEASKKQGFWTFRFYVNLQRPPRLQLFHLAHLFVALKTQIAKTLPTLSTSPP